MIGVELCCSNGTPASCVPSWAGFRRFVCTTCLQDGPARRGGQGRYSAALISYQWQNPCCNSRRRCREDDSQQRMCVKHMSRYACTTHVHGVPFRTNVAPGRLVHSSHPWYILLPSATVIDSQLTHVLTVSAIISASYQPDIQKCIPGQIASGFLEASGRSPWSTRTNSASASDFCSSSGFGV